MRIKIVNGSVSFGADTILSSINFNVNTTDHIGIVGRNGCGKTTLINAILGNIPMEKGVEEEDFEFIKEGNPKIGYIKQDSVNFDDSTLISNILSCYKDIIDCEDKIKKLEAKMSISYDKNDADKYNDLIYKFKNIGGYEYKKEYELALSKFGFNENDKLRKMSSFSLGQRTRISLMLLILSKPDLLLLDEPTNHLDIDTICFLEDYLKNYKKSFIIISHDRMFLDRVVSTIYEIEYGCLTRYKGNYSSYLKQKKDNYNKALKDYEFQQKEIKRLKAIVDRFKYKPSKASMAMSKLSLIERMVKVECPNAYDNKTFNASFVPKIDSYKDVLKIKNLTIGYDKVINVINGLNVTRGDKIGIIGHNGSGKSTFLKTILGSISKISGKYTFGERVSIGYFDQNITFSDVNNTMYDEISMEYPDLSSENVRGILGAFNFSGDDVFKKISDMSGGERVRLMLCKIMQSKPNLLILDEPTNHLDMISKETLENILLSYNGTIIFVSHDRYFINKIANKILDFNTNPVTNYDGNYSEYVASINNNDESKVSNINDKKDNSKSRCIVTPLKERSKNIKKLEKIENEILKLEDNISKYNELLSTEEVYMDYEKSREVQKNIDDDRNRIKILESAWDEISKLIS